MRRAIEMLAFTVLVILAIYTIFISIEFANWILTQILSLDYEKSIAN
jgi:hypothetical protein